ncbi:packaged DNA stabilization protein [Xanthomonas albilineans]|uniref:packaged DNA stabilization protein n=1 Tax=Xanthomonas albilineans TaxID=29447 RepID=UPI000695AB75|nr:packaged DNA stabilization protein [Xanthomonas albilineans]
MDMQPLDLIGGFYTDASRPWSVQDTVNYLPEAAEASGTRTQTKLTSVPGMRLFGTLGTQSHRGAINVEGALFMVAGNTLYEVHPDGSSMARGTIPGVGRVSMAYNQVTNGNQLLIVTGQSSGYVWDTAKSAFSVISDDAYPGGKAAAFLDSYLLQVEPFGRFWFFSDLADALSYTSIDRDESEGSPDKIVTLIVHGLEVVVFNTTTIEYFWDGGTATGTFVNKRILIERGCASGQSVVKMGDTVIFLGDDGVVYRLDGYKITPISTGAIQQAIKHNNWSQSFAFKWEDDKHKVYYLTMPDGHTWGYDFVSNMWHRRESYGLHRWRLSTLVRWNNMWIGGDYQDGRMWVLDWDTMMEGDQPLVSERTSGVVHNNQALITANRIELLMGMGSGATTAERKLEFCYSKDGGNNWSSWREYSMGEIGQYANRIRINRLGAGRNWVFRMRVSSPVKRDLYGAVAYLESTGG